MFEFDCYVVLYLHVFVLYKDVYPFCNWAFKSSQSKWSNFFVKVGLIIIQEEGKEYSSNWL